VGSLDTAEKYPLGTSAYSQSLSRRPVEDDMGRAAWSEFSGRLLRGSTGWARCGPRRSRDLRPHVHGIRVDDEGTRCEWGMSWWRCFNR